MYPFPFFLIVENLDVGFVKPAEPQNVQRLPVNDDIFYIKIVLFNLAEQGSQTQILLMFSLGIELFALERQISDTSPLVVYY